MNNRRSIILFLACALGVAPLQTPAAQSIVLGPNDRIVLQCPNVDELPKTPIRIDGDGHVTLPFIGRVKLAGLTVSEAEQSLDASLGRFVRNPEVSLNIVESYSQPISVLGAVNKPGSYQLEGEKTLAEVIGMAGGLRADAGNVLKINRRKSSGTLSLPGTTEDGDFYLASIEVDDVVLSAKPALNIDTKPFDVISVAPADIVYVVGQVKKPGGFAMTGHNGVSILQALSLAEGLDRTAAPKKARIIRRIGPDNRQDLPVDLSAVLAGKAEDISLHPNDILFIPNSGPKTVGARAAEAVIQAATGMAIYGRY